MLQLVRVLRVDSRGPAALALPLKGPRLANQSNSCWSLAACPRRCLAKPLLPGSADFGALGAQAVSLEASGPTCAMPESALTSPALDEVSGPSQGSDRSGMPLSNPALYRQSYIAVNATPK